MKVSWFLSTNSHPVPRLQTTNSLLPGLGDAAAQLGNSAEPTLSGCGWGGGSKRGFPFPGLHAFYVCHVPKVRTEAEGPLEAEGQELISFQPHSMVSQAKSNPDPKPEERDFASCKEGFVAKEHSPFI